MTTHSAPPYDPAAELAVLGLALDSTWRGPIPDLQPPDFWVPAHRRLWEVAAALSKPIWPTDLPEDLLSLAREACRTWTMSTATRDVRTVKRTAASRRTLQAAVAIVEAARSDDLDHVGRLAHQLVLEVTP